MKNLMILLLSVTLCSALKAQEKSFSVLGKVLDAETKLPLAGASAYCQNTTQGTVSNNQGFFLYEPAQRRLRYGSYLYRL